MGAPLEHFYFFIIIITILKKHMMKRRRINSPFLKNLSLWIPLSVVSEERQHHPWHAGKTQWPAKLRVPARPWWLLPDAAPPPPPRALLRARLC